MRIELVEVTPEMARKLLERNTRNRNLRSNAVKAYAADMLEGSWNTDNGETLKLTEEGDVVDGQHRLSAVVLAGIPVKMFIAYGVQLVAQETIDTGLRRTFADTLKLRGETNYNTLAAVVRRVHLYKRGFHRLRGNKTTPSIAQLSRTLEEHSELRRSAHVGVALQAKIPLGGSTIALCHWMFDVIETEDADWFFGRLADGANLTAGHPVNVLLRSLTQVATSRRGSLEVDVATAWTIKAWNAYREGREITFLRWSPGGANPEAFPKPH